MKKSLCFFLVCLLILPLVGCREEQKNMISPVKHYYCKQNIAYGTEGGIFDYEERESYGYEDNTFYLISRYLRGPESSGLSQTFPNYTRLIRCYVEENAVSLHISNEIADLSGIELTMACVAMTMTVYEITGIETVTIRAESQLLDGKEELTFRYSDFVYLDEAWMIPPVATTKEPEK